MSKILFGILNWNRPSNNVKKLLNKVGTHDKLVVTDKPGEFKVQTIVAKPNIAASKNLILNHAIQLRYDYCFIIEDDVKVVDNTSFEKYINLMEFFNLNFVMYGFDGTNTVLKSKPNPALTLTSPTTNNTFLVNRFPCSSVMGFKVSADMVLFDERLQMLETEYYALDSFKRKLIPFNGFYFDLNNSWNYFSRTDDVKLRQKTNDLVRIDVDTRKEKIDVSNNIDEVMTYVIKKMEEHNVWNG